MTVQLRDIPTSISIVNHHTLRYTSKENLPRLTSGKISLEYKNGITPAPGEYAAVYKIRKVSKTPTRIGLLGSAWFICKLNPAAMRSGIIRNRDKRRRKRLPLLSIVKYARGENLQISWSQSTVKTSTYIALAKPNPKLSHKDFVLDIAIEFELMKLFDRNENMFMPDSCLRWLLVKYFWKRKMGTHWAAMTTQAARQARRFL